jgi:hypothetical protein
VSWWEGDSARLCDFGFHQDGRTFATRTRLIEMMRSVLALFCLALVVAGCGSNSNSDANVTVPHLLAPAKTPDEWAQRVVNRLLRPLNQDLVVLSSFNSPQVRVYIVTQNEQALATIHNRLSDLQKCTQKLDIIGKPPGSDAKLEHIDQELRAACAAYEQVATKLTKATDLFTTGKSDKVIEAEKLQASASTPSRIAAQHLGAAIKTAQSMAPFRRAGLKPSV